MEVKSITGLWLALIILARTSGDYSSALRSCPILVEEDIELHFQEPVQCDINDLSIDFAGWLATAQIRPNATSRVGILSSLQCQQTLHQHLDRELCTDFKLLVKASSLLFNRELDPNPLCSREELNTIRCLVGSRLLSGLETALKKSSLTQASK